jgi:serine/threonine-protein kinase
VVQVYDYGTDADGTTQYIVMQLITGRDLASLLRERGPLSPEQASRIGAAVALALDAAHRHGLIHRDVKPGNILLTADGDVLVTDFGISRAVSEASMTVTGTTIGSVHYFSPEQAAGEPVTAASDIYSLGIVLYEMLSGRRPFEGESAAGVALKRLNEDPAPLASQGVVVPPALEAVVMRAMARDPAARYPDAAAMAGALRSWSTAAAVPPPMPISDPTVIIPPPIRPATTPPARKSGPPWWIWLLGLLAVIMLGTVGFLGASILDGLGPSSESPSPSASGDPLPNWVGRQIVGVRQEAEQLHLVLVEQREASDAVPLDVVISTTPGAGQPVASGSTVHVVVSSGSETVAVPTLIGQTRTEASATLDRAGLVLGQVSEEPSGQPSGTVIRSNPTAGTDVAADSQVDIVLSSGPTPSPTPSPTPVPTPVPPTPTPVPSPT